MKTKSTPSVYMVASYQYNSSKKIWIGSRTWGWFPTLREASEDVSLNVGDLHETTFNYVIIEEVYAGICSDTKVVEVYKWRPYNGNKNSYQGKWVKCRRKPRWTQGIIGLTL